MMPDKGLKVALEQLSLPLCRLGVRDKVPEEFISTERGELIHERHRRVPLHPAQNSLGLPGKTSICFSMTSCFALMIAESRFSILRESAGRMLSLFTPGVIPSKGGSRTIDGSFLHFPVRQASVRG